jgi:hypothetical protein
MVLPPGEVFDHRGTLCFYMFVIYFVFLMY